MRSEQLLFVGLDEPTLRQYGMTADTCDSPAAMSLANGFGQDRVQQRGGHFTGFASITQEDAACSVSSGAIRDRSQELLSAADIAISRLQRCLLTYARAARDQKEIAALRANAGSAIGVSGEIGLDDDWRVLVPHHRILSSAAARVERSE